jgi:hypothetical protein
MRIRGVFSVVVLLLTATPAMAQRTTPPLAAGDRVRVRCLDASWVSGRFGGWRADTVLLRSDTGSEEGVPQSVIVRIERHRRPDNARLRRAALWVGLPFGVLGGLAGAGFSGNALIGVGAGAMYGIAGGAIGALLALPFRGGGWMQVPPADWGRSP